MKKLLTPQKLGEFGEFIYKEFVRSKKIKAEKTNIKETDLRLIVDNKIIYVDVKSSFLKKERYKGRRPRNDIFYEKVFVKDNYIQIFPDKNSPLEKFDQIKLDTNEWLKKWKNKKPEKKLINQTNKYRDMIKSKIKSLFINKNFKVRVVIRGNVGKTGWSSKADNIPGSYHQIKNHNATIYVQLAYTKNYDEKISKIYFFNHSEFGKKIKLTKPDKRQQKKGIKQIIDWSAFRKDCPDLIFESIKDLIKTFG